MNLEFQTIPEGLTVEWAENPMETKVILDDRAKELLKWKCLVQALEDGFGQAHFYLDPKQMEFFKSIRKPEEPEVTALSQAEKAFKYLDSIHDWEEPDSEAWKRAESMAGEFVGDLLGPHYGDCICSACTCGKCWAESLVGFGTIPRIGKGAGTKIHYAFIVDSSKGSFSHPRRTLDEAIEYMRTREFKPTGKNDDCIPRWTEENANGLEWLIAYRAHFLETRQP